MPKNNSIFKSWLGKLLPGERRSHHHYKLVNDSPLFDRDWYLNQYPDVVESGIDPVQHYLLHGARDGRDPGPAFSTRYYLEEHLDVSFSEMNPLVHYILHGKKEHRKISASLSRIERPTKVEAPDNYKNPFSYPLTQCEEIEWIRQETLVRMPECNLLKFSGITLGKISGELSGQNSQCDLSSWIKSIIDYNKLVDVGNHNDIQICRDDIQINIFDLLVKLASEPTAPTSDSGKIASPPGLVDIWLKNEYDLVLRFEKNDEREREASVIRLYQTHASSGRLYMQAEVLVDNVINFVKAGLLNPYYPVLVTCSNPDGELQSVSLLPFPSFFRGGAHYGELCAVWRENNYMDHLLTISSELLMEMLYADDSANDFLIAKLAINLCGANGSERIFQADMLAWLARVMKIRVIAANTTNVSNSLTNEYLVNVIENSYQQATVYQDQITQREKNGTAELILAHDSIPSLHILVSRQDMDIMNHPVIIGSFVVTDQVNVEPKWQITPPQLGRDLLDLQPIHTTSGYPVITLSAGKTTGGTGSKSAWTNPSAIRFCNTLIHDDAILLMPVSPGIQPLINLDAYKTGRKHSSITVILDLSKGMKESCANLLQSLQQQITIHKLGIIVIINPVVAKQEPNLVAELKKYFTGEIMPVIRNSETDNSHVIDAISKSGGEHLLFVDQSVILHDPRTLDELLQVSAQERVASISCMLIADSPKESSNKVIYYSAGLLLSDREPGICLAKIKASTALPLLTFSVLANSSLLQMSRKNTWLELNLQTVADDIYEHFNIAQGVRAIERGYVNYCTTVVSASIQLPNAENESNSYEHRDGFSFDHIYSLPVTIVREFQQ